MVLIPDFGRHRKRAIGLRKSLYGARQLLAILPIS
jgi:hypothetical protein